MKEIRFDSNVELERLDVEEGYKISNEGLEYLPSSLQFLNIHSCPKINLHGLKKLPPNIRLIFSFKSIETNLVIESIYCESLELLKYFVQEKKANLNQMTREGLTPLFVASQNGFLDKVKFLLQNGSKVNQRSQKKEYLLHINSRSSKRSHNFLDENYNSGITPLYIVSQEGHLETLKN